MRTTTRREVLGALGISAGASLFAGCEGRVVAPPPEKAQRKAEWAYVRLDPAVVAADAYRLFAGGGCMYGLCAGIVTGLAKVLGEPYHSFPLHMMRYGERGVRGWGSLCGTLNGAAAIIGLVEPVQERQEPLVSELFSWYEATELPAYAPAEIHDADEMPGSVARSVLCHISVGRWVEVSGEDMCSNERLERCRRLTADVALKTVELLNRNLEKPGTCAGLASDVRSCVACHGKPELNDTMGKMRCTTCHKFSKKHP